MKNPISFAVIFYALLFWVTVLPASAFADSAPGGNASEITVPNEKMTRAQIEKLLGPHMQEALPAAQEIRVYGEDEYGRGESVPFAVLSEHSHPHMFHLMKRTKIHLTEGGIRLIPNFYVDFLKNNQVISGAAYYPDLGILEDKTQRGIMHPELNGWLQSIRPWSKWPPLNWVLPLR